LSWTITRLHHNRRTFSWNYKGVPIRWPLTLTLSISWMRPHVGTIVCKFGSDPAILHGFWDIKLQRYWRHDLVIRVTWRPRSFDVTTGFPRCGFLLVVNMNGPCISHGCQILRFKDICVRTLTFWGHVTSSVTWPLDSKYSVSYRWSIRTDRLSRTVIEILRFKCIGVRTLAFRVTWRHRSCDHWILKVWFPIGSQYEPTMYLTPLLRY